MQYTFDDLTIRYPEVGQSLGLELIPTALLTQVVPKRDGFLDPLVHLKLLGDDYGSGFSHGHTMRNGASNRHFHLDKQTHEGDTVLTELSSDSGLRLEHRLRPTAKAFEVTTSFINGSDAPVTLEMLTSFSMGGITPFHESDAPDRLRVHRFRSVWSAEGRLVTESIEQLNLERSWAGHSVNSERFGQIGSMPVRRWFPFVAVEDTAAGVVWGAQIAWAGSWQLEIFRSRDEVCLSGGLADREFGHWMKTVQPGERLDAPTAIIACVHGSLDDLCDCLTSAQQAAADTHPEVEQDLPIVFNEYCTTWGDPQQQKVLDIADRLKGTPVRYLIIDAGWYKSEGMFWSGCHGDWVPSLQLFPDGLEAMAQSIRDRGLIPGLWFEMETIGTKATAFKLTDHQLKRDGVPIVAGNRRFWDLNDPFAVDYLTERVIGLLERCGFGYLKVDYNDGLGIGSDHPDSLGEGLRLQTLASYRFFERIRERLPNLVIENCSSGGHRHEPSMLARTAMSSFSDAHEGVEIPIIAANLQRLMLPRQTQVWAVIRAADSEKRLAYSLAATFLGRMCISGEITEISDAQMQFILRAEALYGKAAPIIKHGNSRHYGEGNESWRHPQGWQAVVRTAEDGASVLIVIHTFENPPDSLAVPLPVGNWTLVDAFPEKDITLAPSVLHWSQPEDFAARILILRKT